MSLPALQQQKRGDQAAPKEAPLVLNDIVQSQLKQQNANAMKAEATAPIKPIP